MREIPTPSNTPDRQSRPLPADVPTSSLLRGVMREKVQMPLAALRASLESLSAQAREGRSTKSQEDELRPRALESSARQFCEVSRHVQTLLDFCQPPTLHPETCRLSAVLHCTTAPLTKRARRALIVAAESSASVRVDTARLGHCLSDWIELVVESGASQVLLIAREEGPNASFTLLSDQRQATCEIQELQHRLLEKEVERMGGGSEVSRRGNGSQVTLRFEALNAEGSRSTQASQVHKGEAA